MTGSVKLVTAGSGTLNLQPASSIASDVTVNVPSQNCTLDIQGPAFSATAVGGSQSLTSNVETKILFANEEFDTNNNFSSSRFTPTVAGYYQINSQIQPDSSYTAGMVGVYKNGSAYKYGNYALQTTFGGFVVSSLVYCNGSTDYIEIYGIFVTGQAVSTQSFFSYFQGSLVRAA